MLGWLNERRHLRFLLLKCFPLSACSKSLPTLWGTPRRLAALGLWATSSKNLCCLADLLGTTFSLSFSIAYSAASALFVEALRILMTIGTQVRTDKSVFAERDECVLSSGFLFRRQPMPNHCNKGLALFEAVRFVLPMRTMTIGMVTIVRCTINFPESYSGKDTFQHFRWLNRVPRLSDRQTWIDPSFGPMQRDTAFAVNNAGHPCQVFPIRHRRKA